MRSFILILSSMCLNYVTAGFMTSVTPTSRFIAAAKEGDLDALKSEIAAGIDVNIPEEDGMAMASSGYTALHYAVYSYKTSAVEYLLTVPKINVNKKDAEGKTALFVAVSSSARACSSGSERHKQRVPLSEDFRCKETLSIVKALLAVKDIDVNSKDNLGRHVLGSWYPYNNGAADDRDNTEILKSLLAHPNIDVTGLRGSLFYDFKCPSDYDRVNYNPIHGRKDRCQQSHESLNAILSIPNSSMLSNLAVEDKCKNSALEFMVEFMIDHPTFKQRPSLVECASYLASPAPLLQLETIKLLLGEGDDVNAKHPSTGQTALMILATVENSYTQEEQNKFTGAGGLSWGATRLPLVALLDAGADPNIQDKDGMTAPMLAIAAGSNSFRYLYGYSTADMNLKNNDGEDVFSLVEKMDEECPKTYCFSRQEAKKVLGMDREKFRDRMTKNVLRSKNKSEL
jgi:ankyrin repeat protein